MFRLTFTEQSGHIHNNKKTEIMHHFSGLTGQAAYLAWSKYSLFWFL